MQGLGFKGSGLGLKFGRVQVCSDAVGGVEGSG